MMEQLKPCPFCGSPHIHWNEGGWIECLDCHIFFQVGFTNADKEENIDMWNTRADRKTEPQYSEDDMYWLSLVEDVANGKMSDAGANQAWLEYINHKDEPTISKMEQVDKDINVRSKTEPQTCSVNGRPYDCGNCEYFRCTADEPQTERSE